MKLLLDENLSYRLLPEICGIFPGSTHLREIGLVGATDDLVWEYARQHGYVLISKDMDFYQRSLLRGAPPKVVWIRIGNSPTSAVIRLLNERRDYIRKFVDDVEATLLILDPTTDLN